MGGTPCCQSGGRRSRQDGSHTHRTQSPDTEPSLEAQLFARYRGMSVDEKLEHIGALGRLVVETALGTLQVRYPDASEAENRLRLLSRSVDAETMKRLHGWDPSEHGA